MNEGILLVQTLAHHPRPAHKLFRFVVLQTRKVRLRINDGVKIAAVGHVDRQRTQVRAFDRQVTDADVRRFLGHLADQEPEVAAWSEETTQKTRSNLTRFLQDAGVLQASGRGQYVVLPQYLATPVRTLLDAHFPETLRLLEALR